ncbi:MAG TPA: 50S ribosomal protein L21e [Patescibacteria group bacterium]|nr:50S ribosomal protein L21e [Patescibacteria group bacterium]
MKLRKRIRTKGKIQLSRYFQELKNGDMVSVIKEASVRSNFPLTLQGRTGEVEEKRGKAYIVRIKTGDKEKKFLIEPIHLKKLKPLKKQ